MKTVTVYTDGACSGNPGPGGWACILEYGGAEKMLSGGEEATTNNRMELTAVIQALLALKEPCVVELYSDSKYVIDALEKGWAWGWRKRGWVKSDKKPALNPDLWELLLDLTRQHELHYHWVKGHAANEKNNRCDEQAVREWQKFKTCCAPYGARGGAGLCPVPLEFLQPERLRGGCGASPRYPVVFCNPLGCAVFLAVPARGAARPPFLSRGERKRRRRCKERRSRGPSDGPP